MSITNSLLVRYRGTHFIEEDAASIATYGRKRGFFTVADNYTESGARAVAQMELRRLANPKVQVNASAQAGYLFTPGAPGSPYRDVWPGDQVQVTNWDDEFDYERIESITMEQSESDIVQFSFEIESKQDSVQRRLVTTSKIAARGLLGGQTERVAPIRQADGQVGSGYLEGQDVTWSPKNFEIGESPTFSFQRAVRPYLARFTWVVPCTSASVVQVRKNGVALTVGYYNTWGSSVVVPAGTGSMWCLIRDVVVAPGVEVLSAAVTAAGAAGQQFSADIFTAVVHTS